MEFCRTSPLVVPVITKHLAISSAPISISFLVKNIALGFPVVPLEVCNLTTFSLGTARSP